MKEVNTYKTKQREIILKILMQNKNKHITIEDIIKNLENKENHIGRTTVYRYVNMLVGAGVVRKYVVDTNKPACFQYIGENLECKEHYHLKCSKCEKTFHVDSNTFNNVSTYLEKNYDFKIDNSKTVLYGNCNNCN